MSLLAGDVTADPLTPEAGELPVRRPAVDPGQLARWETDPAPWRERAAAAARFLRERYLKGEALPPGPPSGP
jgi:O-succinylbenzoate synthase